MLHETSLSQKFDPEFVPAIEINGQFSLKHSMTQESIATALERIPSVRDEHMQYTDQNSQRENKTSCNASNNIVIARNHTIIQSNETNDSGITLYSGQNSSNYHDTSSLSFIAAHAGGLVEFSSSTSTTPDLSLSEQCHAFQDMHDESQEYNQQAAARVQPTVHASGVNAGSGSSLNSIAIDPTSADSAGYISEPGHQCCQTLVHPCGPNSQTDEGWRIFFDDSGHVPESQDRITTVSFDTLELVTDEHVCEHAQNSIVVPSSSSSCSGSISPELDEMLSINSDDHPNTGADSRSTGCNISTNDRAATQLQLQVHCCSDESIRSDTQSHYQEHTINQAENCSSIEHMERGIPLGSCTDNNSNNNNMMMLAHVKGMDSSSLSLMCDTEYCT